MLMRSVSLLIFRLAAAILPASFGVLDQRETRSPSASQPVPVASTSSIIPFFSIVSAKTSLPVFVPFFRFFKGLSPGDIMTVSAMVSLLSTLASVVHRVRKTESLNNIAKKSFFVQRNMRSGVDLVTSDDHKSWYNGWIITTDTCLES